VANVRDVVSEGELIDVKLMETNERGQFKLSRREVMLDEGQGLTLVHFSAKLERFVLDRGCS